MKRQEVRCIRDGQEFWAYADQVGREFQVPAKKWAIFHRDREWAREAGDPLLVIVVAREKLEAEVLAESLGHGVATGCWAVEIKDNREESHS
jgi:hypothetical protein